MWREMGRGGVHGNGERDDEGGREEKVRENTDLETHKEKIVVFFSC